MSVGSAGDKLHKACQASVAGNLLAEEEKYML